MVTRVGGPDINVSRRKAAFRTGLESPRCSVSLSFLQVYVQRVCEDVFADPLNSAVQLAGLRLLTNMTVTNDYQHLLSSYITGLLHLLLTGNGITKVGSRCAKLRRLHFPSTCMWVAHTSNPNTLGCGGRRSSGSAT